MKKWIQLSFDFKPWDDEEIWKDVINGKYALSKKGILIHKRTKKVVKGYLDNNGYICDCFNIDGKIIRKLRHRLVYEAFVGEIPEGMQINHISECKTDNRLENLNLMTCKENSNWGTRNERSAKNRSKPVVQKTLQGEVIAIWSSATEVEKELGYNKGNIGKCCRGKLKTAYKNLWQYTEEKATA